MAVVLSSPVAHSILLRSPPHPSPSPSPTSTPLPALTTDLSSSSSSSTSGSCHDLHRNCSTRRIRFAPLPDPRRDELFDQLNLSADDAQPTSKPTEEAPPHHPLLPDDFVVLSPSVSPESSISSAQSTPTIRVPHGTSPQNKPGKPNSKLLRPFSFLRRFHSSPIQSPLSQSASLPSSRNTSVSSLNRASSSAPTSPFSQPSKLSRISAEDILSLGTKSLFRSRSGSGSGNRPRAPSPPPGKLSDANKSLERAASTGSGAGMKLGNGKRDWGESPVPPQDSDIAGSGPRPRRASSSSLTPGAGGGRHTSSTKMLSSSEPRRPSTSPGLGAPKKHVKMLNGRVYGAKRYAAQTLANPFANVRDEPEFVEWGYGGMGSVHASAGLANDMWKGLQRSERGGALLAGSSFGPSSPSHRPSSSAGGGVSGVSNPHAPVVRRKMSLDVPECGMGNVSAGGIVDDDDGSGMGWVKRRRAEREAKARLEQAAKELEKKEKEGRKSSDSMDAGTSASIISTASVTASTSVTTTTDLTTPATSPLCSRSTSATDLSSKASPSSESPEVSAASPSTTFREPTVASCIPPSQPSSPQKDDHEHHVLTAVRLSPKLSSLSHKRTPSHGRTPSLSQSSKVGEIDGQGKPEKEVPSSPVDTEETAPSASSSGDDEERLDRDSDEDRDHEQEQEQDDDEEDEEDEAQEVARKTALGAGVEKISRHVDVEAR